MGAASGRDGHSVIEALRKNPSRFDFFQAVRVMAHHEANADSSAKKHRTPSDEEEFAMGTLRFRALPSLGFPHAHVQAIRPNSRTKRPEMTVTFLGMIGPAGVLPQHYTELVIRRTMLKDDSLRDFLDIFHHRAVSLFYRAWAKYRPETHFERNFRSRAHSRRDDDLSRTLFSLIGLGTKGLRNRTSLDDEVLAYYSGIFASRVRCATGLESMVSDFLGHSARVEQMLGRWLELSESACTRLSGLDAANNRLGVDTSLGSRVWDVGSKIRVHLGPLSMSAYSLIKKGSQGYQRLCDLVRSYVGADIDYDFRLTLDHEEAPMLRMTSDETRGFELGRSTWLRASRAHPLPAAGSIILEGV
jgi:type VI secretion system protein ImpH